MCKTLFGVFGSLNIQESVSMITGKNKTKSERLNSASREQRLDSIPGLPDPTATPLRSLCLWPSS